MKAEFSAAPAFLAKRHFLLPDTFAGCSALLTMKFLSRFFLAQCLYLLSPRETGHEVCSPPLCLAAVTTQARVKSLQNCQDLVLWDKDGVLFLSGRRVLSLSDPYLPEERQIASPRNCAHQGQKLPTQWSRADWCHRAWFMLTSIWTWLGERAREWICIVCKWPLPGFGLGSVPTEGTFVEACWRRTYLQEVHTHAEDKF